MAIGEYLIHYNVVRVNVLGSGELQMSLLSLPDVDDNQAEHVLEPINMDAIGRKTGQSLANFKEEAAQLHCQTTEIDEVFTITRIIVYKLPVDTGYPA